MLAACPPVGGSCTALLSLPMSLRTGVIHINTDGFGSEIVDFAGFAVASRCDGFRDIWMVCSLILLQSCLTDLS